MTRTTLAIGFALVAWAATVGSALASDRLAAEECEAPGYSAAEGLDEPAAMMADLMVSRREPPREVVVPPPRVGPGPTAPRAPAGRVCLIDDRTTVSCAAGSRDAVPETTSPALHNDRCLAGRVLALVPPPPAQARRLVEIPAAPATTPPRRIERPPRS